MERDRLLDELRGLLKDVLQARFDGAAYSKLSRVHGYADGYMRALMDSGLVDKDTLIEVVCEERRRFVERESVVSATVAA